MSQGPDGEKRMISIEAVRDNDGAVLGKVVFDIRDRQMARQAMSDLLDHVYAAAADPLNMPPFTFKFDNAAV